ncbi:MULTISPECIES: GNAT family N-acetyltransferase [unclassified Streptomyces]|uniref:GNAT family N-acetyltransferase n=1 Tax=unclassified Streptomyces TaxID=2593676 RepID=UPI002E357234|nr:GNAT family N-acetyltransferase [Streptomyces sp. NBC_01268]
MIVPEIRIRAARLADERVLAELDRTAWSPLHAVLPAPEGDEPFYDERHLPEHYLVAELPDAGVVGFVRLVRAIPLPSNAHVRQIQGLVVGEAARGKGVARALVRAAMDRARRQGATRITLRVLGHNAPARALYEAEGFAVEGVLPGEFLLEGTYVDDVCMGRSLS